MARKKKQKGKISGKKIFVFYHAYCADGFGGAWAAWKKLGSKAEYRAISHDEKPYARLRGKEIYFVDIVPLPADIKKLLHHNTIVVIDHHKTAETATKLVPHSVFNVSHSAAVLAWRYFHPKRSVPKLLKYVEDRDLWRWKLPNTLEIMTYLDTRPASFTTWDKLAREFNAKKRQSEWIKNGKLIVAHDNQLIDRIIEKCTEMVSFAGYRVPAVNSSEFESAIGQYFWKEGHPFGLVYHRRKGIWKLSLRSNPKGGVDVSKIARRYGGGGHPGAAGISIKATKKLPWQK